MSFIFFKAEIKKGFLARSNNQFDSADTCCELLRFPVTFNPPDKPYREILHAELKSSLTSWEKKNHDVNHGVNQKSAERKSLYRRKKREKGIRWMPRLSEATKDVVAAKSYGEVQTI